jgi:hypothetical protein
MLVSIPLMGRAIILSYFCGGRQVFCTGCLNTTFRLWLPMVSQVAYLLVLMHRCAVENVDKIGVFTSLEYLHHCAPQSRQSAKRFSSRWNWDSPTPLAAGECAKGVGSPNSNEGTYTVVLYI